MKPVVSTTGIMIIHFVDWFILMCNATPTRLLGCQRHMLNAVRLAWKWEVKSTFKTKVKSPPSELWLCSGPSSLTVGEWHIHHAPAAGAPALPNHSPSHPQQRLTSAHTAMTTPVTTTTTSSAMATAAIDTHLWCQKWGLIYFANVFTSTGGLLLTEPDWHGLMENKWAEPHLIHGALPALLVGSPGRDMKGDGSFYDKEYCREWEWKGRDKSWIGAGSKFWAGSRGIMCLSCPNNGCCAVPCTSL